MYLKFTIIPPVLFIFTEIHMQLEIAKYETHQTDFSFKACPPPPPCVNLRGWTEVKIQVFSEYEHVAYRIEEDSACRQHGSKC